MAKIPCEYVGDKYYKKLSSVSTGSDAQINLGLAYNIYNVLSVATEGYYDGSSSNRYIASLFTNEVNWYVKINGSSDGLPKTNATIDLIVIYEKKGNYISA